MSMFAALESVTEFDSEGLFKEMLNLTLDCVESLQKATSLSETISNLENLRDVVSVYGFSESLMAFVNKDNHLSNIIPEIPSLESYIGCSTISSEAAVEELEYTIKKAVIRFKDAFVAHVIKYKNIYKILLKVILYLNVATIGFLAYGAFAAFPASFVINFLAKSFVIHILPFSVALWFIDKAKSLPLAVNEALDLRLPTTETEKKAYQSRVHDIFQNRAKVNVFKFEESFMPGHNSDKKTLKDLGYTEQNISQLTEEVKATLKELDMGDHVANRLEGLYQSKEAETQSGREALVWITEIATKSLKLTVHSLQESGSNLKRISHTFEEAKKEFKE